MRRLVPVRLFSGKWVCLHSSGEADVPTFCIQTNNNLQVGGLIMNAAHSELLAEALVNLRMVLSSSDHREVPSSEVLLVDMESSMMS